MKKSFLALGLSLLMAAGCTQSPGPNSTSSGSKETLKDAKFTGGALPARVENLQGTALLSDSVELSAKVGSGTAFILLNPTDPTKGVLVVTKDPAPSAVATKPSGAMNVTGDVKTVSVPDLSPYKKEIVLASQDGKVQYVEASAVTWPIAPTPGTPESGTPGTPGTPESGTPATPGTPASATPGAP